MPITVLGGNMKRKILTSERVHIFLCFLISSRVFDPDGLGFGLILNGCVKVFYHKA